MGTNSSGSDQTPVSDLRRLWAMVSKPDFGHALPESHDEVRPPCKDKPPPATFYLTYAGRLHSFAVKAAAARP